VARPNGFSDTGVSLAGGRILWFDERKDPQFDERKDPQRAGLMDGL
jgi:hypothetical protein